MKNVCQLNSIRILNLGCPLIIYSMNKMLIIHTISDIFSAIGPITIGEHQYFHRCLHVVFQTIVHKWVSCS
jgi:hypothetical protein